MMMAIMLTYRCNAKCSMCNVWKNPSLSEEEISLGILKKIPDHLFGCRTPFWSMCELGENSI